MHAATFLLPLCLQNLGETAVLSPVSPTNMDGAMDSTESPLGPIFVDHPETVGADGVNGDVLAGTTQLTLEGAPRPGTSIDLAVRVTTLVLSASYGLTEHLDATLLLPVLWETLDVTARVGPFVGHTSFSSSGVSDLTARLKYAFNPNLAATLRATFPTGDASRGLGTGDYWLAPGIAAFLPLGERAQLNASARADVNLSTAARSGATYGLGGSVLLGPVALVAEFLGGLGHERPFALLGADYSHGPTFDLAFGLRAPLPHGFMVFAAGTYALNRTGLRPTGVAPVVGIGWVGVP